MPKLKDRVLHKIESSGISAKRIILPAMLIIFCFHAVIVFNTIRINRLGQRISQTMQLNFTYAQTLKTYESVYNAMSDRARLYADTGEESYLRAYCEMAKELARDADDVKTLLAENPAGPAVDDIEAAVSSVEWLTHIETLILRRCAQENQVSLLRYSLLMEAEPAADEYALSRVDLLSNAEYLRNKMVLNSSMDSALEHVSKFTAQSVGMHSAALTKVRALQWVMTLTIIAILAVMCVLVFTQLLTPLELSVEQIQRGEVLPADRGLLEFRRLAYSYNELLHHRKMMENYLRQQSQTDALTKLNNRLAFQNFISDLSWRRAHSAVTVFSLDVNGLKEANDNNGHTYGDELLRNSAACVQEAFGGAEGRQCFRFGGDEFAAIWVDVPASEIDGALRRFKEAQAARNISISVGCARTDDLSTTSTEELFERADKVMYEEKAKHYKHIADGEA